jgi:phenylalanyl-tRNA synthetase beta chain
VVEAWGIRIRHEVAVFELKLMHIFRAEPERVVFRSLPRYPAVERDVALLVDEGVTVERVTRAIGGAPCTMIEDAQVFDFYKGKGIPEGKKSLAFNIRYRSAEGTLTDEDVERMHADVVAHLIGETGAEVRGA